MHPEGRGGHVVADKERDVLERRQRRLKRLRAEKDELHSALQESRRRVRQLEAAQLLFALPEVPRPELTELSDLSPASASEELPGLMDQVEPQGPPPAAQNLLRWRQLRQILQSHQETLEHEEAMWQQVLQQQEEDAKQLKLRCGEAEEMHRQTEGRMQHLMDLMVALLSPGRTQENQQEMVNSRYLAMIEDLETYCESMTERIAGFQGALEGERGENCCRALQLCDQQRRTTRLHETLCKLQSELFWTRPGSVLRPAGTGPREFCQVDTGAESTQAGEAMRPLALSKSLRDDSAEESAAERDVASSMDATFVHAVPATDEVLEVLSPKRTVTPRTPTPRERMENFMREILEELHFEHLVVRNSSGYAFGPCGRAQLRLEGEEVMASKDGVVYQPFKDFILQLQEQEHASVRPGPDESRNGSQHGAIQDKKTGSEARSCRPGASAVERVQNAGATSKQDIATVTGGSSAPALLNGQVARVVPQQEVIATTPRGDLPRSKVDKKGVYLDASIVSARTVGFVPPVVHSPVVVARRCCWQTNTAQITLCNGQFPQLPLHKR